jgi:hypothetical protein
MCVVRTRKGKLVNKTMKRTGGLHSRSKARGGVVMRARGVLSASTCKSELCVQSPGLHHLGALTGAPLDSRECFGQLEADGG